MLLFNTRLTTAPAQPDRFEIVANLVRNPHRHIAAGIPSDLLVADPFDALIVTLSRLADVVIEVLGGVDPAYHLILGALSAGRAVISANKELIAAHWETLSPYMNGSAARLRCSVVVVCGC